MVETVGMKLRRARTLRQLSLDDVARATKIRVARLADLESDVYTNFPNIAYAKGFLTSYGRYLGVDVRPYLDAFEDTSTFGLDDYQYLSETPVGLYRVQRRPQRQQQRRHRGRLAAAIVAAGTLVAGLFLWFVTINVQRLGDLSKLADHQEAREHPKPPESMAAPAPGQALAKSDKSPAPNGGPGSSGPELAMADFSFFFSPSGKAAPPPAAKAPILPLPGDGSVLREMTLGSSSAIPLAKDADHPSVPAVREEGVNSMTPSVGPLDYRYVHALGGSATDALEDDARQSAPVRVNNTLE